MASTEKITPLAGAATALSTLLCCMPTGFAAAVATTSAGLFVTSHQQWFLLASVALIAVGFLQLRAARRRCSTAGSSSVIVLCISAAIVLMTALFPQVLAGLMADWLG